MGTWTALTNQPTFNASTMLLLTDGTVMCQAEGAASWWRLTPDSNGSYVHGTWSALADMHNSREYYASAVLRDGRVIMAGGEYSDAGGDTDKAEIYDPAANTWTSIGNPGWGQIGDAAACLLADGRLLAGNLTDGRTAIYDPVANTWTATGSMAARSNEETWTLLPDGSVVTVSCANHPNAERYIPSSGSWISAGSTPVELVQASSIEIGPAPLLPDGRVFAVGATGKTAIYTPPGNSTGTGSWAAGPNFPVDTLGRPLKAKDAPGCLLPNGRVLCVAGPAATVRTTGRTRRCSSSSTESTSTGWPIHRTPTPSSIRVGCFSCLPVKCYTLRARRRCTPISRSRRARRMETDRDRLPDRPAPRGQLHPVRDPAQWAIAGGQLWR